VDPLSSREYLEWLRLRNVTGKRGVFLVMALLCIGPGESPKERD
jgi:hypothetical protein